MPTIPISVDRTVPLPVYRREGYAERIRFSDDGVTASFGPGGHSIRLELYESDPDLGRAPEKIVTHLVGSDPGEALLAIPAAELIQLTGRQYYRQVWLQTPLGEEIILSESIFNLKS